MQGRIQEILFGGVDKYARSMASRAHSIKTTPTPLIERGVRYVILIVTTTNYCA